MVDMRPSPTLQTDDAPTCAAVRNALLFVGPFPPPIHGHSVAAQALARALEQAGLAVDRVDTSGPVAVRLRRHLVAGWKILRAQGAVYISANSDRGMLLSVGLALLARLRGAALAIHHHSYDYVRRRRPDMALLAAAAGRDATHIVLGPRMAEDLRRTTPEVGKTLVLNNAGLVDAALLEIKRTARKPQVLAHLSNLTGDKGIGEVVEAAIAAVGKGFDVRLVVGGIPADQTAERALERARTALGERFEFRGAVHGEDKTAFFRDADVFLFPSRYRNEAEPLVILEALAAGVPCIAFDRGCIAGDIGASGGIAVPETESFAEAVCGYLAAVDSEPVMKRCATAARTRFRQLLREHEAQRAGLVDLLAAAPRRDRADGTGRPGRKSLFFLWENFGPYHLDRLAAAAERFAPDYDVFGIQLFARSGTYDWEAAAGPGPRIVTLFDDARPRALWTRLRKLIGALPPARGGFAFFCHYHRLEVFCAALVFRLRGGRVFVMNNSKYDDSPRSSWREAAKRFFMLPYHGGVSNSGRASDYMRFLGVPPARITSGYNTVSLGRIRREAGVPPAPDGPAFRERHFIAVARLVPKKNLGMLLDAYALYRAAVAEPRDLQLCGSGPDEDALKAQARRLGIAETVHFHGWLQAPDVARQLGRSLALLLPSVEEQFGNVVIEAQAMGLPVVLSDACGARDRLVQSGMNGFVVEPDNPDGMARFMADLSENEALWRRMATAAIEGAWKGDAEQFAEGVEQLISRNS